MKKNIRKTVALVLSLFLTVLTIPSITYASELDEVNTRTTVNIVATVPQDFKDNIAIVLEQESTQVRFQYALTADNGYTGSISVVNNSTYKATVSFPNQENYKTDIAESYDISGENVNLAFTVTAITYSAESDTSTETVQSNTTTHGEEDEIDSETGLTKPEVVLKKFSDTVSFIQDDPKFLPFLTTYSGAMFEKYYLEADPMNTEEQWEQMNEVDRFIYYMSYYNPYVKIMNLQYDTQNQFIEELIAQKNILSQIENGDVVYDAIVEVWKWHYQYWQTTGTFCNFFSYYDGANAGKPTTAESVKLTDEDKSEIAEAQNELKEELGIEEDTENTNPILAWAKDNILTCIIFIGAGIAFLVVYLVNRKKNISDRTEI